MKRLPLLWLVLALPVLLGARTFLPPTMGWSSWNTFALNINEAVIRGQADAMVKTGLARAGYRYVNIDDGYWDGRASDGSLRLNDRLFPSGMRSLVDYIHSLDLLAGIYSDAGDNTCGSGNTASWGLGVGLAGYEERDCRLYFDDWDFDFIKVDYCGGAHMKLDEQEQYTKIARAIRSCHKQGIVYNVCRWAYPGAWVTGVADSWRTTGDIYCDWSSVKSIILENLYLQAFTFGGHYNDADMLEIGRTLSPDEEITHMAYWCIMSSPLLIGCDMTQIPEFSLNLLKNADLIAMNQDSLGIGAPVVQRWDEVYVVAKDMERVHGPKRAVVAMNLSDSEQSVTLDLSALEYTGEVRLYDCLSHTPLSEPVTAAYTLTLPAHGSAAYFLEGVRSDKTLYQAEEAYLRSYTEISDSTPLFLQSPTASLGAYVSGLGSSADNYLEWRDVYSTSGGSYTLTLTYASSSDGSLSVSVNDSDPVTLQTPSTGDNASTWRTAALTVTLKAGTNTIRVSNPSAPVASLDCMELTPVGV